MRINFQSGKFVVDPEMDFDELNALIPFAAFAGTYDLKDVYRDLKYTIVDGGLYGWRSFAGISRDEWHYYDPSVRKWSECDDPTK